MQRKLIVNADGFGFTYGNNRGIFESLDAGFIRSVSVNVNFPAVEELGRLAADHPHVSVGIHFNLAVGEPVADPARIPTLLGADGRFLDGDFRRALFSGKIAPREIEVELQAQVMRMLDYVPRISHFDGHRNAHTLPLYFNVALKVARAAGISRIRALRSYPFTGNTPGPMDRVFVYSRDRTRVARDLVKSTMASCLPRLGFRSADRLIAPINRDARSMKTSAEMWRALLEHLPHGSSEVFCHPGYVDETLKTHALYVEQREVERRILSNPGLVEYAATCGVELISFWDL